MKNLFTEATLFFHHVNFLIKFLSKAVILLGCMLNWNLCKTAKRTNSRFHFFQEIIQKILLRFKRKACFSKMFSFIAGTVCINKREAWLCGGRKSSQTKIMQNWIFYCCQNVMCIMKAVTSTTFALFQLNLLLTLQE